MFLSKDEREERKRKKAELTAHLDKLRVSVAVKKREIERITNDHITQTTGKWEYLELSKGIGSKSGGLEQLGEKGWELAGVESISGPYGTTNVTFYFKRKIVPLSKDVESEIERINEEISQIQGEMERFRSELDNILLCCKHQIDMIDLDI